MKRIIAMLLCLLTLSAVLPLAVSAETAQAQEITDPKELLCKRIEEDYQRALVATGKKSLGGYIWISGNLQENRRLQVRSQTNS